MLRSCLFAALTAVLAPLALVTAQQGDPAHPTQGAGTAIVLENAFIKKYMDRATMETEFRPVAKSRVHKAKDDGEVHIGGIATEARLATVAEVMNAGSVGKKAMDVFAAAIAGERKVNVAGAWRLWCEHSGGLPQVQGAKLTLPLPGPAPSNPDHVFEIHPVTTVQLGDDAPVSAREAIRATPGHTPHDAQKAFQLGYDRIACRITPLADDRTRIETHAIGFNFTEFIIRLRERPFRLEDGHSVMAEVFDTDGEFISHRRRMIFVGGTEADEQVKDLTAGKRLQVIGIPRISLKLIDWRLRNRGAKDEEGQPLNPLRWNLPYELIIVSAVPVSGEDD
jgi:hypothetical protein